LFLSFCAGRDQHPKQQLVWRRRARVRGAVERVVDGVVAQLHRLDLQREINSGLNIVEGWQGVNDAICFGKSGELANNRRDQQEGSSQDKGKRCISAAESLSAA
jgi:hypothetical protein